MSARYSPLGAGLLPLGDVRRALEQPHVQQAQNEQVHGIEQVEEVFHAAPALAVVGKQQRDVGAAAENICSQLPCSTQ